VVDTVEIVNVDLAPAAPGVTVGDRTRTCSAAQVPLEQLSVTTECSACLRRHGHDMTARLPRRDRGVSGETPIAKSVTAIWKSMVPEYVIPLLLAATDTMFAPAGQVIVAPGASRNRRSTSRSSAAPFGSTKPSCSAWARAERAVGVEGQGMRTFPAGSVALTDAKASARPAPTTLSAAGSNANALPISRSRTVWRALAAGTADAARFSRHGALCSSNAAIPPHAAPRRRAEERAGRTIRRR